MHHRMLRILLFIPLLILGACGVEADFSGHAPDQVWRALKAVSENPDYDHQDPTKRWTVVENIVHVDEQDRRIDINRQLQRVLRRPRTKPLFEDMTWHFQVSMPASDASVVRFENIGPAIPTKVQFEGDRYFAEVRRFLAGLPLPEHLRSRENGSPADTQSTRE